ncbi:MAG TPA: hypothetical protein VNX68_08400 [Nitrosopumilaceae archaeon]|jgi:hypothetical protein|nr:hypothetical protein [Nitrosopumilaceae archaeon]
MAIRRRIKILAEGEARTYSDRHKETVGEWLIRHKVPRQGDKYILYHATPKRGGATNSIRQGSYLAEDAETALHQAGRDRSLKSKNINLHKLLLAAEDIEPGVFPTLRRDVKIDKSTLVKIK